MRSVKGEKIPTAMVMEDLLIGFLSSALRYAVQLLRRGAQLSPTTQCYLFCGTLLVL